MRHFSRGRTSLNATSVISSSLALLLQNNNNDDDDDDDDMVTVYTTQETQVFVYLLRSIQNGQKTMVKM